MKAIETIYRGYRFRSRTEARWAVFFDAIPLKFEYEPQGFVLGGLNYLPDFFLPQLQCWLEVKGTSPSKEEVTLCAQLAISSRQLVVLAVGTPDAARLTVFDLSVAADGRDFFDLQVGIEETRRAKDAAKAARFEFGESGAPQSPPPPSPSRRRRNPYLP